MIKYARATLGDFSPLERLMLLVMVLILTLNKPILGPWEFSSLIAGLELVIAVLFVYNMNQRGKWRVLVFYIGLAILLFVVAMLGISAKSLIPGQYL